MQILDGKLCEALRETLSSHKWSCPETKHTPEWEFFLEMAGFLKAFQGLVSVFFLKNTLIKCFHLALGFT